MTQVTAELTAALMNARRVCLVLEQTIRDLETLSKQGFPETQPIADANIRQLKDVKMAASILTTQLTLTVQAIDDMSNDESQSVA